MFARVGLGVRDSRECLAIKVKRKLNSTDVIDVLTDLFILRGAPAFIRSDNGPEFVAQAVRDWIAAPSRQHPADAPAGQWSAHRPLTLSQDHPSRDIAMRCPARQCVGEWILRKLQWADEG